MDGLLTLGRYIAWLRDSSRPAAIYRGHADTTWKLTPTAFRALDTPAIKVREQLIGWRRAAARFSNPMPHNAVEWLVLAQHYGIATPLLDWTTNPLIALFFACQSQRSDTDGCVVQCSRTCFIEFNEPSKVDPFRGDRVLPGLIDASAMNLRTLAQDSVMSVHSVETATVQGNPDTIDTFEVERDEKAVTLACLRRFGLSNERLFADLPTVAQEFKASLLRDEVFGTIDDLIDIDDDMDTELRTMFK